MRTPNYVLKHDYPFTGDKAQIKIIPAGSFVRPVELTYIPDHLIEEKKYAFFNEKHDVFCYTKFGFIVIPRNLLEER